MLPGPFTVDTSRVRKRKRSLLRNSGFVHLLDNTSKVKECLLATDETILRNRLIEIVFPACKIRISVSFQISVSQKSIQWSSNRLMNFKLTLLCTLWLGSQGGHIQYCERLWAGKLGCSPPTLKSEIGDYWSRLLRNSEKSQDWQWYTTDSEVITLDGVLHEVLTMGSCDTGRWLISVNGSGPIPAAISVHTGLSAVTQVMYALSKPGLYSKAYTEAHPPPIS